jgi:hypothetical protein
MVERLALARVERRARQLHARLDHHPRVVDADLLADALEDGLHDGARARGPGVEMRRQEVEGPVEDFQEVRSLGEHGVMQRRGGGDHALAAGARRVHAEQADIAGRPRLEAAIVGVHGGQAVACAEPRRVAVRGAPVGHGEEPAVGAQSLPHRLAEIVREPPADYPRLVLGQRVEAEPGQDRDAGAVVEQAAQGRDHARERRQAQVLLLDRVDVEAIRPHELQCPRDLARQRGRRGKAQVAGHGVEVRAPPLPCAHPRRARLWHANARAGPLQEPQHQTSILPIEADSGHAPPSVVASPGGGTRQD